MVSQLQFARRRNETTRSRFAAYHGNRTMRITRAELNDNVIRTKAAHHTREMFFRTWCSEAVQTDKLTYNRPPEAFLNSCTCYLEQAARLVRIAADHARTKACYLQI